MTRLVTLRGLVAGCTACGGVWIDHLVGSKVLKASVSEEVKAFIRHIGEHASGLPPIDYRTAARRDERTCPGCGNGLLVKRVGRRRIELDLCEADGTFFDLRELDTMIVDAEMTAVLAQVEREKHQALLAEKQRDGLMMLIDELLVARDTPARWR